MSRTRRRGAEEARNQLSDLLAAAERGSSTIITRHGRAIAALIPVDQYSENGGQDSLLELKGSGHGMWGKSSSRTIRDLRSEWSR